MGVGRGSARTRGAGQNAQRHPQRGELVLGQTAEEFLVQTLSYRADFLKELPAMRSDLQLSRKPVARERAAYRPLLLQHANGRMHALHRDARTASELAVGQIGSAREMTECPEVAQGQTESGQLDLDTTLQQPSGTDQQEHIRRSQPRYAISHDAVHSFPAQHPGT